MTPAEVRKRYSATIEAAIAKAKASRTRETVGAHDGAEVYASPILTARASLGA